MTETLTLYSEYMKDLLKALYANPIRFDSHPLGNRGITDKLTKGIDVTLPDGLKQRACGIQEAIRVLGILILDSLRYRLAQSKRNKPLERRTKRKRRERMTIEEQEIVGLLILWSKHIEPATRSSRFLSDKEAINAARRRLKDLLEDYQLAEQSEMHRKWISRLLVDMSDQGRSGARSAVNYQVRALVFLLRRIVENTTRAGFAVEDVLPDFGAGVGATQALTSTPEVVVDAAVDGATEREAQLAQCIADYRAYELGRLKRWLDKQWLPPIADWFQIRRVRRLASQAEKEAFVSLESICQPGQRTVLLGHPGSGTTAALWWLSSRYCEGAETVEPVVLRLDAREYVRFAISQSPYGFLSKQVYGSSSDSQEKRRAFEDLLSKAEAVCLLDNLDKLGPADQRIIGRQLWSFSGLTFSAQAGSPDDLLMGIGGDDVVQAELAPLEETQVVSIIRRFADRNGVGFDADLAYCVAQRELPEMGGFPLGLELICQQVLARRDDCASIIERLINELVENDEKLVLRGDAESSTVPFLIQGLAFLAWHIYPTYAEQEAGKDAPLEVDEEQMQCFFIRPGGEAYPFLIPTGSETWRFFSREVFSFLVAMEEWWEFGATRCGWRPIPNTFGYDILGLINRHYLALCERIHKESPAGGSAVL